MNDFFNDLLDNMYEDDIWIGFRLDVENDAWKWGDSTPFSYTNWAPGLPDERGPGHQCGMVRIFFCFH